MSLTEKRKIKITPEKIRNRLDNILPHVQRPGRYFSGEVGLVRKEWEAVSVRLALAFPDIYELATANYGHQIIYYIVNNHKDSLAERVYAPWPDMEAKLKETGTPLYTLESCTPVRDFDLFGFSLTHELCYSNILQMLDLAGLELRSKSRGFPIVIGGGPAVFNPEPVAEFFDIFLLGDGEEAVVEIIEDLARYRDEIDAARGDREAEIKLKIRILASWGFADGKQGIRGVYVPSHFDVSHDSDGRISGIKNIAGGPEKITKALVRDLNSAKWVTMPLMPHIQGVENRVTVEPARGCTQGCRFCQAGMIYRPWRVRDLETVIDQAEKLLESTGRTEQSFLALSVTDWEELPGFVDRMKSKRRDYHLRITIPSSRPGRLTQEMTDKLADNRKGGLTIAIEAGTERLRKIINKQLTDEDIETAIGNLMRSGWDYLKLYFMIGHPGETDDDVKGIIRTVERIQQIHRDMKESGETSVPGLRLRVSVSTFVPKSHTPFQWAKMISSEETNRRQKMLTPLRKMRRVEYKSHDIDSTWIEGIMSRGDRRLSGVIENAYRNGARFDAWNDICNRELFKKAMEESGLDPEWYFREREHDEIFPWDHLDCGVDREWLLKDWKRSGQGIRVPDCNDSTCLNCGMTNLDPDCVPRRIPVEE